jgi:hypothetical protein
MYRCVYRCMYRLYRCVDVWSEREGERRRGDVCIYMRTDDDDDGVDVQ